MAYTYAQLVDLAKQAGFPAEVAPTMAAISLAESSGNPSATHRNTNSSTDYGLWQINSIHSQLLAGKNWSDPLVNAQMALSVYRQQGLKAWSTYNSGAYRRYTGGVAAPSGAATASAPSAVPAGSDPFGGVTSALSGIGQSFQGIAGLAGTAQKLALPQTWVRIMAGVFGVGLVGFGVIVLTREVKHG
jgi:hypothetical protein